MELKNGFRGVELGESPLFINTMGNLYRSDEYNSDDQFKPPSLICAEHVKKKVTYKL